MIKPSFSVIIPVLNESLIINQTIEHIYQVGSGTDIEVIVIDGDREGKTISAIKNKEVIKGISPRGRGKQMNKGASLAQKDILVFLHTDTELPGNAFGKICSVIEETQCLAGAFDLGIRSPRAVFRIIEKAVYLRTRVTRIPFGDQTIFIKKECFDRLNGFQEIPLMEDVEFMSRLKRSGYKICIIPQKVKTSPRRWEKEGVFYCTMRNWILRSLYLLGVPPDKLVKFYYRDWAE